MLSSWFFMLPLGIATVICDQSWLKFGASFYYFNENLLTWEKAQEACKSYGGKLVEIETAEENVFLQNLVKSTKADYAWLGATDGAKEGTFIWATSQKRLCPFTDMHPTEPDQGTGANCLKMWSNGNYKWGDESCSRTFRSLCEVVVTCT